MIIQNHKEFLKNVADAVGNLKCENLFGYLVTVPRQKRYLKVVLYFHDKKYGVISRDVSFTFDMGARKEMIDIAFRDAEREINAALNQ